MVDSGLRGHEEIQSPSLSGMISSPSHSSPWVSVGSRRPLTTFSYRVRRWRARRSAAPSADRGVHRRSRAFSSVLTSYTSKNTSESVSISSSQSSRSSRSTGAFRRSSRTNRMPWHQKAGLAGPSSPSGLPTMTTAAAQRGLRSSAAEIHTRFTTRCASANDSLNNTSGRTPSCSPAGRGDTSVHSSRKGSTGRIFLPRSSGSQYIGVWHLYSTFMRVDVVPDPVSEM